MYDGEVMVSVIITHRNRWDMLRKCIEALEKQDYDGDFEVIVVDDASTLLPNYDLTILKRKLNLKIIFLGERCGPGKARNIGAKEAKGRFLAFLEDDVIPSEKWLSAGMKKLLDGYDVVEGITLEEGKGKVRRFEEPYEMLFLACNLIVRKDVFEKLGGYSERYFEPRYDIYFREDTEFGVRAMEKGYRCSLEEEMVVVHPPQHISIFAPYKHAMRFYFDPLFYREHPFFFKKKLNRKKVWKFSINRPLHYIFVLNALSLILVPLSFDTYIRLIALLIYTITLIVLSWKYKSFRIPYFVRLFTIIPLSLWYLYWFIKGCVKFRGWGALL